MATIIRLKRRTSAGNSGVILQAGEAYYNIADKKLYIGNQDEELIDDNTKSLTDITDFSTDGTADIKFQIGPNPDNNFEHHVDNVNTATTVTERIGQYNIEDIFASDTLNPTVNYAKIATTASSTVSGISLDDVASNLSDLISGNISAGKANALDISKAIDGVHFNNTSYIHHLFRCETAADMPNKIAEAIISENDPNQENYTQVIFDCEVGSHAFVQFTNGNSASVSEGKCLTLNIAYTGQKNIYYQGSPLSSATFMPNGIYEFIFTGSNYNLITPIDYYTKFEIESKIKDYVDEAISSLITNELSFLKN